MSPPNCSGQSQNNNIPRHSGEGSKRRPDGEMSFWGGRMSDSRISNWDRFWTSPERSIRRSENDRGKVIVILGTRVKLEDSRIRPWTLEKRTEVEASTCPRPQEVSLCMAVGRRGVEPLIRSKRRPVLGHKKSVCVWQ
jgi:hypothetical protein